MSERIHKLHFPTALACAIVSIIGLLSVTSNMFSNLNDGFYRCDDFLEILPVLYSFLSNIPSSLFILLVIIVLLRRKVDLFAGVVLLLGPCYNLFVHLPVELLIVQPLLNINQSADSIHGILLFLMAIIRVMVYAMLAICCITNGKFPGVKLRWLLFVATFLLFGSDIVSAMIPNLSYALEIIFSFELLDMLRLVAETLYLIYQHSMSNCTVLLLGIAFWLSETVPAE